MVEMVRGAMMHEYHIALEMTFPEVGLRPRRYETAAGSLPFLAGSG
jgi:hypothetical protein